MPAEEPCSGRTRDGALHGCDPREGANRTLEIFTFQVSTGHRRWAFGFDGPGGSGSYADGLTAWIWGPGKRFSLLASAFCWDAECGCG